MGGDFVQAAGPWPAARETVPTQAVPAQPITDSPPASSPNRGCRVRARDIRSVLDRGAVSYLLGRRTARDLVAALTDRERDVLAAMAEGCSNAAIGRRLFLNSKTVEGHIAGIFTKLGLLPEPDANRRVLAVLSWLARLE